jgi:hypothetical protein
MAMPRSQEPLRSAKASSPSRFSGTGGASGELPRPGGRVMGMVLKLAAGLLLALVLSQFPEFVQQYRQRLGGAVDALRPLVESFDAAAAGEGLSRAAALDRLSANPDGLVVGETRATGDAIFRYETLSRQQAELAAAGEFGRLFIFLKDFDPSIARRAAEDFEPALPATMEGAAHAAAGFVLGYVLVALLAWFGRLLFRRSRPTFGRRRV